MAGEIAHIVYAARILTMLKNSVSHHSYWVGTVFPDVYRMQTLRRYPTHLLHVNLASIVGQNDFQTGMRVHAWIDATRRHYMEEHQVYERLPWHPLLPFALELFEDMMLYNAYDDWNIVRRALHTIHTDELHIVHERSHVQAWHRLLENYFREEPSDVSRCAFCTEMGISETTADELNTLVHVLHNSTTAQEIINRYIVELEHMLT